MATKNRCCVLPILSVSLHIPLTVAMHLIAVSDVDSISTVNYFAENIVTNLTYTHPNFWSMEVTVLLQVYLFQATVQSYVTDASNTLKSSKSYPQSMKSMFRHNQLNQLLVTCWNWASLLTKITGLTCFRMMELLRRQRLKGSRTMGERGSRQKRRRLTSQQN